MVNFYVFDIALLILFTLGVFIFLKTHKKNIKREGIIFMYRTKLGIKAINYVGNNFKKTLNALKYVIIVVGLFLMGIMIWMLAQALAIYIFVPEITKIVKAPPVAPLIPYFPEIFGMTNYFPSFYFTYFIIALAIVAIVHEFSHGIYMKLFGIKIKSTGFVFLGPILGAFVEEEKTQFEKKKKLHQMSVLGAGVFANVIMAIIFYLIYALFFSVSFAPSGYIFNNYAATTIPIENISSIQQEGNLYKITALNSSFYLDENLARQLNDTTLKNYNAYFDSPAFKSQIKGAITQIDDVKIKTQNDLRKFLENKNPKDEILLTTINANKIINTYNITLGEHPLNNSIPFLGVSSANMNPNIIQKFTYNFMTVKNFNSDVNTSYSPIWNEKIVYFILHLLWWIILINFFVALFNMLPLGILDGGKFFYLAILSITGSEKFAKSAYKFATYAILSIFILIMLFWAIRII
ncbi:MAG: site-2 protease family protein [Candidatus Pacearchaeota archaeon]